MELTGPWPYLLFLALDGAAGVCAVLLVRRAARAESGLAPRLAVWGLVAASSTFNWTHAPRRPAAPEAFGLMPVVAAVLFEFCLRELRLRTLADQADRTLSAWRWLHPAERIRVQLLHGRRRAAPGGGSHQARPGRPRGQAALPAPDRARRPRPASHAPGAVAARRIRRAEHRAHRALTRAGFADPATATAVLRQVQVLTMTTTLARLDYRTADAAQAAIANLITSPGHGGTQTRCRCLSRTTRPRTERCRRPRCPARRGRHPHRRRSHARRRSPQPGRPGRAGCAARATPSRTAGSAGCPPSAASSHGHATEPNGQPPGGR